MTMPDGTGGGSAEHHADGRTADEVALAALFAAVVLESPASEVSPDDVIELGRKEQRAVLDRHTRRRIYGRNLLIAAAVVALLAIVLPKLGNSQSDTAATASSTSAAAAAAAPSAAPAAAGSGGSAAAGEAAPGTYPAPAEGSAAATSAGSSAAASSEAAAVASDGLPAATSAKGPPVAAVAGCAPLPAKVLAAVRVVLAAQGVVGGSGLAECTGGYGAGFTGPHGAELTITVSRAAPGACRQRPPGCTAVPGALGAYQGPGTAADPGTIWVYGDGYEVAVAGLGTVLSTQARIAAAQVVIKALG